jgi:hypothetical protein
MVGIGFQQRLKFIFTAMYRPERNYDYFLVASAEFKNA